MRSRQFDKKVLPGTFLGYELIAVGTWKGDILDSRHGRFGNVGCIGCLLSKNQGKGSVDQPQR